MIGLGLPNVEKAVQHTRELHRVLTLPRRRTQDFPSDYHLRLSQALKTPHGTMTLKPVQARALAELGMYGGLFAPIRVGGGKTLITLLAPNVLRAKRPLLLIPASLVEKTRKDRQELAYHWNIPKWMRVESYSLLSRAEHADMLTLYRPDLIIADEVQKLRDLGTAVATRVNRYMRRNPYTIFAALSGTITKRSLRDFAHIAQWTHKTHIFMPIPLGEVIEWSNALDEKTQPGKRTQPGALLKLCGHQDKRDTPIGTARAGFKRRMLETPGVITLQEKPLDIPLTIRGYEPYTLSQPVLEAFTKLRREWITPNEWQLWDAFEIARHARTLALGFYYRWNPLPPDPWYQARKSWAKACRNIIINNKRQLDSAEQVIRAIGKGEIECTELEPWKLLEHTFTPNPEAVWLDHTALYKAAEWAAQSPGVVWTSHTAFAVALSNMTGMSYYAGGGICERTNALIDCEHGDRSIISSLNSNRQGQNLQMFSRALGVSPPGNGEWWQQWLGRHHRPYQKAKAVHFDIWQLCLENVRALDQGERDSYFGQEITGDAYKMCNATISGLRLDDVLDDEGENCYGGIQWGS